RSAVRPPRQIPGTGATDQDRRLLLSHLRDARHDQGRREVRIRTEHVRRRRADRRAAVSRQGRLQRGPRRACRSAPGPRDRRPRGRRSGAPRFHRRTGQASRVIGRLAITVACVLGGVAFLGGVADAHANYLRPNPASAARLVKPPAEVRIEFSEPPDPKGSDIQVLDTSGKRHDKGDIAPSGDPNGLKVSVGPIGEGGYLVAWTATSAVDGHTTKGNFAFVVGSGPLPAVPDVGASAPPPEPLEIAGRALSYAGIALGLGTAFFVLFLRVPAESEETRREAMLLLAAGALL